MSDIDPNDLEITTFRNKLAGGQQVGVTNASVRVKHIPTGIAAECDYHRSQMKNRDTAIAMIERGLAELGVGAKTQ